MIALKNLHPTREEEFNNNGFKPNRKTTVITDDILKKSAALSHLVEFLLEQLRGLVDAAIDDAHRVSVKVTRNQLGHTVRDE